MGPLKKVGRYLGRSERRKRFSRGVAWSFVGSVTQRFFSFISTLSIARILGPQGFGEFGMILSTLSMVSVYGGFRLGSTATRYIAESKQRDPVRTLRIVKLALLATAIFSTIVIVLFALGAPYLADHVLERPGLTFALIIAAALLGFMILNNVLEGAVAGFENFKNIAYAYILRGIVTLPVCIGLAYYYGVNGAVLGLAIAYASSTIPLYLCIRAEQAKLRTHGHVTVRQSLSEAPILWKFALPGVLTGALMATAIWLGRLILTRQEDGYTELGIFMAADQWRTLILFLPAVLFRVFLPTLSEAYGRSGQAFGRGVYLQFRVILLITLPLAVGVISFAELLAAAFGKNYAAAATIIPPLIISVYFAALSHAIRQVYDSAAKRWIILGTQVVGSLFFLIACLILIPQLGAIGLAYAYIISNLVMFIVQMIYAELRIVAGSFRRNAALFTIATLIVGLAGVSDFVVPDDLVVHLRIVLFSVAALVVLFTLRSIFSPAASKV